MGLTWACHHCRAVSMAVGGDALGVQEHEPSTEVEICSA